MRIGSSDFDSSGADLILKSGIDVVLIAGRGDSGYDGSITNTNTTPSPLIVTTSTDVTRNFKTNLSKSRSSTDSRVVYLATTRTLRQNTRQLLERFAQTNRFRIGQIFDQTIGSQPTCIGIRHGVRNCWDSQVDLQIYGAIAKNFPTNRR